ncbi:hypothetical protein DOE76_03545 [Leifsonia sp. ku-ls]|nr:hypothetical protein DOE76_03545 [Leifsonia sp. ku-ls]
MDRRRRRIGGHASASAWAGTIALLALGVGLTALWLALRVTPLAATPAGADPVLGVALAVAALCCVLGATTGAVTLHRDALSHRPHYARRPPAALRRPARHLTTTR